MIQGLDWTVERLQTKIAKDYIRTHHYTRGCHNGPSPCYGLFQRGDLIGVLMFATPCSENVRASVFGPDHKDAVVELHRLHVLDVTPRNAESWFISRSLKLVATDRPKTRAVISFADATQGHVGTIYRATNALFYGTSSRATFWLDDAGRLRHPRQNGTNIDGAAMGWRPMKRDGKYRYLWLVGDKRQQRESRRLLKLEAQPYPRNEAA